MKRKLPQKCQPAKSQKTVADESSLLRACTSDAKCCHPDGPYLEKSQFHKQGNDVRSVCKKCVSTKGKAIRLLKLEASKLEKPVAVAKYCSSTDCERQGELLPPSNFSSDAARADGLQSTCRVCVNAGRRRRRPDAILAGQEKREKVPEDATRTCVRCGVTQPLKGDEAAFKESPHGFKTICEVCETFECKDRQRQLTDFIDALKQKAKCTKGEQCASIRAGLVPTDPLYWLEFAHYDRETKNNRLHRFGSEKAIIAELQLGRFLCCLCHIVETQREDRERPRTERARQQAEADSRRTAPRAEYVNSLKLKRSQCAQCHARVDPRNLPFRYFEFDHLPGHQKISNVAYMVDRGFSEVEIDREVAKCDLVCRPCHHMRTRMRRRKETIPFTNDKKSNLQ